jgi:hypothetical protein
MYILLRALLAVVVVNCIQDDSDSLAHLETEVKGSKDLPVMFQQFTRKNGRSYSEKEFGHRFRTFSDSVRYVSEWNQNSNGFQIALNQFADYTSSEFDSTLNKHLHSDGEDFLGESMERMGEDSMTTEGMLHVNSQTKLPESVDYSEGTGKIYKQGGCRACYT